MGREGVEDTLQEVGKAQAVAGARSCVGGRTGGGRGHGRGGAQGARRGGEEEPLRQNAGRQMERMDWYSSEARNVEMTLCMSHAGVCAVHCAARVCVRVFLFRGCPLSFACAQIS